MAKHFASGLLGGVTAAVIWISISLMTEEIQPKTIGLWGLVILIATTLIATVIASAVHKGATSQRS